MKSNNKTLHRINPRLLFFSIFLLFFGNLGIAQPLQVTVSILPQQYFVQQIAGDRVEVNVMVQAASDPHTYEPRSNQMVALKASRLYFLIGVEFELLWLKRFQSINPQMEIVDTTANFVKLSLPLPPYVSKKRPYEMIDPHVWLSPLLVKQQALSINQALARVDPENADFYQKNTHKFLKKLDALHQKISKILAPVQGKSLVVFHPVWGYFARDYALKQIPIELEGKPLKPSQVQHMIVLLKQLQTRTIFTQLLFAPRTAQSIARATGSRLQELNPMSANWAENLEFVARQILSM